MEEQLLNNGFIEGRIQDVRIFTKGNVDIIFNEKYDGSIYYTPRIAFHASQTNRTPHLDNIESIHDLNNLLNHYRDKHEGEWPFIDNLIEY